MQRCCVYIGDIHRHLCDAILIDEPSNGLSCLKRSRLIDGFPVLVFLYFPGNGVSFPHGATLLAHVKRDGIGASGRGGVEVKVGCDEEIARTNGGHTRALNAFVDRACAKIGLLSLGGKLLGQCFILTLPAHGEVLPFGFEGRSLVAIARNLQFVGNALGQFACQFGTFF